MLGNAGKANTSVGRAEGKGASPESLKIVRQVREDGEEAQGQAPN